MTKTLVTSVDHLIKILSGKHTTYHDFAVQLSHGAFSRKEMALNEDGSIFIFNGIDGTTLTLTPEELFTNPWTNIGKAITENAFFHLNYNN